VLRSLRACWLALLLLLLNLILLAALYGRLPDPVPWPWANGGANAAGLAKPAGALLLPLAHLFITLFLAAAPSMDPGALRGPQGPRVYPMLVAIVSGFLLLATGLVFAAALGVTVSLPSALLGATGALLALIGNYLGKIPQNYMVGIRTPWTLSCQYTWERTHRFAAPLFVASGLLLLAYCVLQRHAFNAWIAGVILLATLLAPFFYSWVVWKQRESVGAA
jgi:uncharacterized membrane protein